MSGKIREKERERERAYQRATITCALFFTLCESINIWTHNTLFFSSFYLLSLSLSHFLPLFLCLSFFLSLSLTLFFPFAPSFYFILSQESEREGEGERRVSHSMHLNWIMNTNPLGENPLCNNSFSPSFNSFFFLCGKGEKEKEEKKKVKEREWENKVRTNVHSIER